LVRDLDFDLARAGRVAFGSVTFDNVTFGGITLGAVACRWSS
jgi:hypothetical protein